MKSTFVRAGMPGLGHELGHINPKNGPNTGLFQVSWTQYCADSEANSTRLSVSTI